MTVPCEGISALLDGVSRRSSSRAAPQAASKGSIRTEAGRSAPGLCASAPLRLCVSASLRENLLAPMRVGAVGGFARRRGGRRRGAEGQRAIALFVPEVLRQDSGCGLVYMPFDRINDHGGYDIVTSPGVIAA